MGENYYYYYLILFIFLFMAVLGLRFCARAFSGCGKRGPLFIAVRGPLTIAASLVAEHTLQTCRLSNCGSRAQLLRGTRDPPRPGLEPTSPALAGRVSTTAPPGKPPLRFFILISYCLLIKSYNFFYKSYIFCCIYYIYLLCWYCHWLIYFTGKHFKYIGKNRE